MERYLAIDHVCAWPNLTKMPDGTILATIFNQPCHGLWEGDVECWASEDGGRTWRLRGTPAPHAPGTNRMNVAAGLAANGDLLVLASGWSHRPRRGEGTAGHGPPAHSLVPWVCRSADGGRTWRRAADLLPPEGRDHLVPFGDLVPLRDGCLGGALYGGGNVYFYVSADEGETWSLRSVIEGHEINETALLVLPEGEVLACSRTVKDQHLELFRSPDHGRTWTREQAVSVANQHPAHLLNLPDGRVLLTYGNRRQGHEGVEMRVSADAGHKWSTPRQAVALEPSDFGYPATVPSDGDTLVTAWYSGDPASYHYHMGVLIWTREEMGW